MRAYVFALLLISVAFAGCAGADGSKSAVSSSAPPTSAAPATVTADTGGMEGTVTNDEAVPVVGAQVALLETDNVTRTDPAGRFSFSDVPPGTYSVVVEKLGFEGTGKKVSVVAGEIARADFQLLGVVLKELYSETFTFAGYIRYGQALVDIVTDSFGVPGCEACTFDFNATGDTEAMVFEILFTPTVANPTGPTLLGYQIWDDGTNTNYAGAGQYWPSRSQRVLDRDSAKWPEEGQSMYWLNYCDLMFVCVEQRFDAYLTIVHNGEPEEGFSALPPE